MRPKKDDLAVRYAAALGRQLAGMEAGNQAGAVELGKEAAAAGIDVLGMAKIHSAALEQVPHGIRAGKDREATRFFSEAVVFLLPSRGNSPGTRSAAERLGSRLSRKADQLASSRLQVRRGMVRNRELVRRLRANRANQAAVETEARRIRDELRRLTRRTLSLEERQMHRTGTRLRDEIAQTLIGINVWLGNLRAEARRNSALLRIGISRVRKEVSAVAVKAGAQPSPKPKP